jgi:hypothetical protein
MPSCILSSIHLSPPRRNSRRNGDIQRFHPGFRKGREAKVRVRPAIPRPAADC